MYDAHCNLTSQRVQAIKFKCAKIFIDVYCVYYIGNNVHTNNNKFLISD